MPIIKDRELLNEDGTVPGILIQKCLEEHQMMINRYNLLDEYYNGKHKILGRAFNSEDIPNNRLVCNHAEYITDMATGYFIGNPITYKDDDIKPILENFDVIDIHNIDTELCRDISKFGVGYEMIYMSSDEIPIPKSVKLDPRNTVLVVDDTVEHKSLFGIHYYEKKDINNTLLGYYVNIYTRDKIYHYFTSSLSNTDMELLSEEEHYFNGVPVIEYWNKSNLQGDYESVITLIDAYNTLQSDRINDKEQQIDAILAVINASFGDNESEMTETERFLKEHKILELPRDADAKWLLKQFVETEVEVLKKAIKDDIHEFSKVPCLTDENFASQASGVAMKYKLLGLEQLAKTKEGYYKIGLRERLKLYANIFNTKGNSIDTSNTEIVFTRALPVNEVELSQMVVNLEDTVSLETRLSLLPFVTDIESEVKKLEEEKQKKIEQQQQAFGSYDFRTSKEGEEDDISNSNGNSSNNKLN